MRRAPPAHKQRTITTLGDYIEQKLDNEPKKLTFEEWSLKVRIHERLSSRDGDLSLKEALKICWEAAEANK